MKKIGINASFLRKPGTGIGQVTANFLQKLTEYHVSGITYQGNTKYKIQDTRYILYTEEPINIDLPANFEVTSFLPKWWKRDDVPRKWLWERELAKRAAADGCDVFLSLYQSSTSFESYKLPATSYKLKHVMVVHDVIPKLFPEYLGKMSQRLHWKAVEGGIRSADQIVAVSEATKQDLVKHLGLSEERIVVAYPDVSPRFREVISDETVDTVLKKYGLEQGYIYHGGGLEVRKNAKTLLEAYAMLQAKIQDTRYKIQKNADIPPLVISGKIFSKENKLATDVEGLVKELGLEEKVKLLGFVPEEDLLALYRGAVFFVYPSLYEGFGLPVLEAMCKGTPVLASNNSSLPEVGGEAVQYCDPHDTDSIVMGMERLLGDEALRERLVARSHAQIVQFSWDKFVEKIFSEMTI